VILGAGIGLSIDDILPFLTSLRRTGYTGSTVLFVDRKLARALHDHPISVDVHLVRVLCWPPLSLGLVHRPRMMQLWRRLSYGLWLLLRAAAAWPRPAGRRQLLSWIGQFACTPMEARFLHYQRYLARHRYDAVLVTDVRDVLFQTDPFAALPEYGLATGVETRAYTIATEPHNARWMTQAYGTEALRAIGDRPVSCVGVTYGDAQAMDAYLDGMVREIVQLPPERTGVAGADTAAHNHLLWTGRLGDAILMEVLTSPIATLNAIDESSLTLGPSGHLQNADGTEPSILHQYDRLPTLGPRLRAHLAGTGA
jgi:hypothetical protein